MPNLIAQVKRTTEDVLYEIYVNSQRQIQAMESNSTQLIASLDKSTTKIVEQLAKIQATSDNILKVANEQFKTSTGQLDTIIKTLETMTAYQNTKLDRLIDLLGSKLKVSIESIPTQDAVVVTNNVLHPFLTVAFLPVA